MTVRLVLEGRRVNEHGVELLPWANSWVPECCMLCRFLDAEFGEFGSVLSGPYCEKYIRLPTRKGTCKRQEPMTGLKRVADDRS